MDIQTAENTGLPCVSVMWGFRDAEFLRKNRAQVLIQSTTGIVVLNLKVMVSYNQHTRTGEKRWKKEFQDIQGYLH